MYLADGGRIMEGMRVRFWLPAVLGLLLAGTAVAAGYPDGLSASPGVVALTATETWEAGVVQEPDVWRDGHGWNMIYTGGWERASLGWATAPTALGPWTKHGQVLGNGFGGWDGPVAHASVFIDRGTFYVYFPSQIDAINSTLRVAVGPDPKHLRVVSEPAMLAPDGGQGTANTSVIRDGQTYRMMFESRVSGPAMWEMGYATSRSPLGPFEAVRFPIPGLQRGPDGMYGGADVHRSGDGFAIWYHASRDGDTILPTDVYQATSPDLVDWTLEPGPTFLHGGGSDQLADPVEAGGWVFYDEMNNVTPSGLIRVAVR